MTQPFAHWLPGGRVLPADCSTTNVRSILAVMALVAKERRRAMAAALTRAAEHLEARAAVLEERVARWRKDRPRDDSPTVARTLRDVASELRRWADQCLAETPRSLRS
jgi:hypothetical protein